MTPIDEQDTELLEAIGQKIKELRKSEKIGYIQLAKKIGISRNALSLMESGKVYFKFSALLKILRYFKVTTQDFFKDLD
ncbi:MAG: helix-turn-helix transcriptional regulator [Cyclobacteriaceae bacterium]|nr:helix-turn-helix transcriptional regulator [Cyclobacteriaceae bacterium]